MRTLVVLTALAIVGAPVAMSVATGEGSPLRGGARNPSADQSKSLTKETEIIANTSTYGTRQSNKSDNGGGVVYGCRSKAGGTAANNEPCVRANNLNTGLAFEFNATNGALGGTFTVGAGGDTRKPFTTNATGVATGLNADRVDGASASDIVTTSRAKEGLDADTVDGASAEALRTRWALVNERGVIEEQSGGFTIANFGTNDNVYINAGSSLVGKGLEATIAIQNRAGAPPNNFSGEVAIARCNTVAVVCNPEGTNNDNTLLVRASDSDGTPTADGQRKRFYVTVTE
jgi:hypothetical protein